MLQPSWLSFLLLVVVSTACEGPETYAAAPPGLFVEAPRGGDPARTEDMSFADSEGGTRAEDVAGASLAQLRGRDTTLAGLPAAAPAERMLTYHGEIAVEVTRPEQALAGFVAQAGAWGGYLQRQQGTSVAVRIPAARFDAAFAHVRALGRVLHEARRVDDVTEEYVDLGIRLDTAQKARDRLLELLQRADKVEDILKIEAELRRLTEEIERMEGRKRFLADQVAMATVQATFTAAAAAPIGKRLRRPSRFGWLQAVGAESVMEDF